MKFLCDRCKTRYSIGDERVRGKILKIRCKNCANVITVREGMAAPVEVDPERRKRPTTQAPPTDALPGGALGAAFASQLAKPPPALEEEWYVSIDGQQQGPFTLADAQRWVASKPITAELHCWSEGFDDWLPVDKVSHFRGLRKPPMQKRPTIPPPIPAPAPRPLFASTMASIEKSAASGPHRLPTTSSVPPLAGGMAARANGVVAPTPIPSLTRPAVDTKPTAIDSPAYAEAPRPDPAGRPLPGPARSTGARSADVPPPAAFTIPVPLVDDDDLDIGEVSRVVKLADLMQAEKQKPVPAPHRTPVSMPAVRASSTGLSGPNRTASMPKISPAELGMNVAAGPMPDESLLQKSYAEKHRRGMMLLIAGSGVMVLGAIALVAFLVTRNSTDEIAAPSLGGTTRVIDTTRPEDIVRQQAGLPPTPPGSGTAPIVPNKRWKPHNTQTQVQQPVEAPDPAKLDATEIEDMAAKNSEGTKRCYIRAQKGALGFELSDLKKIDVTLTVSKDGNVTDVSLSSHGGDVLGQCLVSRIKSWKFRESRGGTFRFALAFGAS